MCSILQPPEVLQLEKAKELKERLSFAINYAFALAH